MARKPMQTRSIRMDSETWQKLDDYAKDNSLYSSEIIRSLTEKFIAENTTKPKAGCRVCQADLSACTCPKLDI